MLITVSGVVAWLTYSRPVYSFNSRDSVLIADFENQTGDPRFDQALETAFTVSMEQSRHANVFPRARLASVLALMGKTPDERITPALGREICQRENIRGLIISSITRTGEEYALSAELIDPQSGDTVRSYSERSYGEGHILDALDVIAATFAAIWENRCTKSTRTQSRCRKSPLSRWMRCGSIRTVSRCGTRENTRRRHVVSRSDSDGP